MDRSELKRRYGRRVQELREAKGLTQEQLATRIARSVDTLSNIERGVNATRIETAFALASQLGVPLHALFELDDAPREIAPGLRPEVAAIMALLQGVEAGTLAQLRDLIEVGLRLAARD